MNKLCRFVCLSGSLMAVCGYAVVAIDTNDVAVAILSYAAMDVEDDLDPNVEYPVRYTDWNGLLDGVTFPGVTRQDKEKALFDYLMMQSTNDLSSLDGELRELIRVGLCECRDLKYTNALPVVRNLMTNPTALYMNEHIYMYYKWTDLDDDYLRVTSSFLSNTSAVARASRASDFYFVGSSISRHKETFGRDVRYTNAVATIYRARGFCPECAQPMDRMFMSEIGGYENSSNRYETIKVWLDSPNCTDEMRPYCVAITNRLLAAPQPLPEIRSLREL